MEDVALMALELKVLAFLLEVSPAATASLLITFLLDLVVFDLFDSVEEVPDALVVLHLRFNKDSSSLAIIDLRLRDGPSSISDREFVFIDI
jgi:hypothetical protein